MEKEKGKGMPLGWGSEIFYMIYLLYNSFIINLNGTGKGKKYYWNSEKKNRNKKTPGGYLFKPEYETSKRLWNQ